MEIESFGKGEYLFFSGVGISVFKIFHDSAIEEIGALRDKRNMISK